MECCCVKGTQCDGSLTECMKLNPWEITSIGNHRRPKLIFYANRISSSASSPSSFQHWCSRERIMKRVSASVSELWLSEYHSTIINSKQTRQKCHALNIFLNCDWWKISELPHKEIEKSRTKENFRTQHIEYLHILPSFSLLPMKNHRNLVGAVIFHMCTFSYQAN